MKLPIDKFRRALAPVLAGLIEAATERAISAARSVGLRFDEAAVSRAVAAMTPAYTSAWLDEVAKTTVERITAATLAYEAGEISADEVAMRVALVFDPARAELMGVTETTRLFGVLNEVIYNAAGVALVRWDTVRDPWVCPECEALDNEVFPVDEAPVPATDTHPNCLTGDAFVSPGGRIMATSMRAYEGDLIVIRTAAGHELTCTPNHPVLTRGGWVPASFLDVGSDVVSARGSKRKLAGGFEAEHIPARIHEVASALGEQRGVVSAPVPTSAPDFHGDGRGSKIAIVRANRQLWSCRDSTFREHRSQKALCSRHVGQLSLSRGGIARSFLDAGLTPTRRVMGSGDLTGALFGSHARPLDRLGLGLATARQASRFNATVNSPPIGVEDARYPDLRLAIGVEASDVVDVEIRAAVKTHVYNLQTEFEWYTGNSIITHNCRCFLAPVAADIAIEAA